jgi:hypothetical protein
MRARITAPFLGGLILGLAGAASAWAQSATQGPPTAQVGPRDMRPGPAAQAPVGHRQPQARDVAPAEMAPADEATRDLDEALTKKLTICRGC